MLMEVKKHLILIGKYFKFNLSSSMEYRASFITQVFGMMVNNLSFVFFWWILFNQSNMIGGYQFKQVMFIWALASSSFGFAFVLFGNMRNISNLIIKGELDTYLLQPKDVFINVIASKTQISAWGDFLYGYILLTIAYGFGVVRLLEYSAFVILGGLLMGSILITAETLTFFIGNSTAISNLIFEFIISLGIYPETIFKGPVRWIIYSIIPTGFIIFIPMKIFSRFNGLSLFLLLIVDTCYILFSYFLFRKGLKRYESGNLMTTKL